MLNKFNDDIEDSLEDPEDMEILDEVILDLEIEEKLSKHKEKGKHSLKYDSIFKGKKDSDDDEVSDHYIDENSKSFSLDVTSNYSFERESPTEYTRIKNLKNELYDIITNILKLNLKTPRRKPSKTEFNRYYSVIIQRLEMDQYTYSEVFIEFAFYFSDNIENMFKLLDKNWGEKIAQELLSKSNLNGAKNLKDVDFQ